MKGNGANGGNGAVVPKCLRSWSEAGRTAESIKEDEHRCLLKAEGWVRLGAKLRRRVAKRRKWMYQGFRSFNLKVTGSSSIKSPRRASRDEMYAWKRNARSRELEADRAQVHALKQLDAAREYRLKARRYEKWALEAAAELLVLGEDLPTCFKDSDFADPELRTMSYGLGV